MIPVVGGERPVAVTWTSAADTPYALVPPPPAKDNRVRDYRGSGCQSAFQSILLAGRVTWRAPLPSAPIVQILANVPPSGARYERENAIRDPSGDHAGILSETGLRVTCRRTLVSRLITQMSQLPPAPAPEANSENAKRLPFGDQEGSCAIPEVTRCTPRPLGLITQIPLAPVKAIHLPFGDHDGSLPRCSRVAAVPSAFMTHMTVVEPNKRSNDDPLAVGRPRRAEVL